MTSETDTGTVPYNASEKQKGASKTSRIPIKIVPVEQTERLKKPDWIRVKAASASSRFYEIKDILRANPDPLDANEPHNLAKTIADLRLSYVVITSVDRDDLRDGGAGHFVECIQKTRAMSPATKIEVLVPDFRGRLEKALNIFAEGLPDVLNHNLETVPRLYKEARPGADYKHSLVLLRDFKEKYPKAVTKSGIMVGLGETDEEILEVMRDMREHNVEMLTIGQYLAPSNSHLPVRRYVHPDVFKMFEEEAYKMGFVHAAVGAMVRSSYHADQQAHEAGVAA
jgi:lipoic acid synthetase